MLAKFKWIILGIALVGLTVAAVNPRNARTPSFGGATAWLNSAPLMDKDLRGKPILVEFWTYTCVNWRRTMPYVRAWAAKYKSQGLTVVGVHTPEFSFEKDKENVRWAIGDMNIGFPVAMDNNYSVWRAFENNYWPAIYLIDARGRLRYHQFGEGNYEETEKQVQQLLIESGATGVSNQVVRVEPAGAEVSADLASLQSPETYLDYRKTTGFASPGGAVADQRHSYKAPSQLSLNQWALSGHWSMGDEADRLVEPNGRLIVRFHGRDLNLVMGPGTPGTPIRFRVYINGGQPDNAHGADIDGSGNGSVVQPRMYQLIRQPGPIADGTAEIEFLDAGVRVYDLTFG